MHKILSYLSNKPFLIKLAKNLVYIVFYATATLVNSTNAFAKSNRKQEFPFEIGMLWSAETISKNYNKSRPVKLEAYDSVMNYLVFKSKLNFLADKFVDSGSKQEDVERVANECLSRYNNLWNVISCVSIEVHDFLSKVNWTPDGYRPGSNVSFCRAHAHTFKQVMEYINYPGVTVEFQNASFLSESGKAYPHVVNQLIVNIDGVQKSYVIDVGWYPKTLFPVLE